MVEWIGGVLALGVEDSYSGRHFLVRHMMVTNNKVYAEFLGIGNLVYGFYATVENDDEFYTFFLSLVDAFAAHPISLVVAVGDVVFYIGIELLQHFIHQCHGCTAIYVVVAIHHDTFLTPHGIVKSIDCDIHVVHKEWVYKFAQHRSEETLCR